MGGFRHPEQAKVVTNSVKTILSAITTATGHYNLKKKGAKTEPETKIKTKKSFGLFEFYSQLLGFDIQNLRHSERRKRQKRCKKTKSKTRIENRGAFIGANGR